MTKDRIKLELGRLKRSPTSIDKPVGIGNVRFVVRCPLGADEVLQNAREVMEVIATHSITHSPEEAEWRQLLPDWFIEACSPSPNPEEAERWLRWWQSLSPEDQAEEELNKEWSLDNWLYWMEPNNRQWTWWDAQVVPDCDHLIVAVEVDCWPFPWGALRWLFKASGGSAVEPES